MCCTVCSLLVLVSDIISGQMVLSHSSVVLVMAVYTFSSVSLDLPQCDVLRTFRLFAVFVDLSLAILLISVNRNAGERII